MSRAFLYVLSIDPNPNPCGLNIRVPSEATPVQALDITSRAIRLQKIAAERISMLDFLTH